MKDEYIYVWLKDGRICRTTAEDFKDGYFVNVVYIEEETYDGTSETERETAMGPTYLLEGLST